MKLTFTFTAFWGLALASLVAACGGAPPSSTPATASATPSAAPAAPAAPAASASAASASASARPTCDAIDEACDPHEGEGGLAKECHDLGESSATSEATCVARKSECLAACATKSP